MDDGKEKSSLDNCYFIKVILMLLIVFYHSCLYMSDGWMPVNVEKKSDVLMIFSGWLNSFHIYAFVLISGYIFYHIRVELKGYKDFGKFIVSKIKRLIVPVIFVTIIWAIPIGYWIFKYSVTDILKRFALALFPAQLWFLWMLFWAFLISWPLSKLFDTIWGCLIVLVLLVAGSFGGNLFPNYFQLWTGMEYVFYFWTGWTLRRLLNGKMINIRNCIILIVLDIAVYSVSLMIPGEGKIWKILSYGVDILTHLIGVVMIFFILQWVAYHINWSNTKFFKLLKDKTMVIYLLHQQIIYLVVSVFIDLNLNPWIQVFINFVISLCGAWLIGAILYKWKATRILLGEKA